MGLSQAGGFSKVVDPMLEKMQRFEKEKEIANQIITSFQTTLKLDGSQVKQVNELQRLLKDLVLRVTGCYDNMIPDSIELREESEKAKVQNIVQLLFACINDKTRTTNFDIENVKYLSASSNELIYRIASIYDQFDLISCLNAMGIRPNLKIEQKSPAFLSQFMDIASTREQILKLLKTLCLSSTNDIVNIRQETEFTKAIGRNYISSIIKDFNLKHIKVPKHTINFLEDNIKIVLQHDSGAHKFDDRIGLNTNQIRITVEKINREDRFLTREEITELFFLVEKSHYCDFNWDNFIPANDGLYIVDTELKSFSMEFKRENIGKLQEKYIDNEDDDFFNDLIQRMSNLQEEKCIYYNNAVGFLSSTSSVWISLNRETIEKSKQVLEDCHSVGFSPDRVFTVSMSEIDEAKI